MKRCLALFAALMIFVVTSGQIKYEPEILILTPHKVTHDRVLDQQFSTSNQQIREAQKAGKIILLTDDTSGRPENIKIMSQK